MYWEQIPEGKQSFFSILFYFVLTLANIFGDTPFPSGESVRVPDTVYPQIHQDELPLAMNPPAPHTPDNTPSSRRSSRQSITPSSSYGLKHLLLLPSHFIVTVPHHPYDTRLAVKLRGYHRPSMIRYIHGYHDAQQQAEMEEKPLSPLPATPLWKDSQPPVRTPSPGIPRDSPFHFTQPDTPCREPESPPLRSVPSPLPPAYSECLTPLAQTSFNSQTPGGSALAVPEASPASAKTRNSGGLDTSRALLIVHPRLVRVVQRVMLVLWVAFIIAASAFVLARYGPSLASIATRSGRHLAEQFRHLPATPAQVTPPKPAVEEIPQPTAPEIPASPTVPLVPEISPTAPPAASETSVTQTSPLVPQVTPVPEGPCLADC